MTHPIVLRGLRRDTLGVLWFLREDGLWESTVNGATFPLAEVDKGPYGPTREAIVVSGLTDAVIGWREWALRSPESVEAGFSEPERRLLNAADDLPAAAVREAS